jgi:hypothetical protein
MNKRHRSHAIACLNKHPTVLSGIFVLLLKTQEARDNLHGVFDAVVHVLDKKLNSSNTAAVSRLNPILTFHPNRSVPRTWLVLDIGSRPVEARW